MKTKHTCGVLEKSWFGFGPLREYIIHDWGYKSLAERKCTKCGREEMLIVKDGGSLGPELDWVKKAR